MMNIPFNKPAITGKEIDYIKETMKQRKFAGDGEFTEKCSEMLEGLISAPKVLLTTSGSTALDMCAILSNVGPGDEVIVPSFTFVTSANAFALRGADIVFVDIEVDTLNIDPDQVEKAITEKTKVIVVVHYAGISCDMDKIMDIAKRHNLLVVEDAAQAVLGKYKDKYLGTIGDLAAFSFHETKNIQCGEGGALVINNEKFSERAEIIREKGTNRKMFFQGLVDKYTWVDLGSSLLPSELNAAFLYAQLENAEKITADRIKTWNRYLNGLKDLEEKGFLDLPKIPEYSEHNGHIFYIKLNKSDLRGELIKYLKENNISAIFHYIPLHSSDAGSKFGRFYSEDKNTSKESERLLRLPLYYEMKEEECDRVIEYVIKFFNK